MFYFIGFFFFFFKQKTAYEIMPSLVGSEMCIRDSGRRAFAAGWGTTSAGACRKRGWPAFTARWGRPAEQRAIPWKTLSLIHISEPTRLGMISYAVFCLKK